MLKTFNTVLFDLDGTLLDTAPDFAYAVNSVRVQQMKEPLSLATVRPSVSQGMQGVIETCFGVFVNDPHYSALLEELLAIYSKLNGRFTEYFPGMDNVLTHLESNQFKWGIVTNKHAWLTDPLIKAKAIDQRTKCIVSGDTTPFIKPHPAPLLHACELLKVKPSECLYIGDAERDILAGQAAGMQTAAALFGYLDEKDDPFAWKADIYLTAPEEIIAYC